jgi:hypothetical protein
MKPPHMDYNGPQIMNYCGASRAQNLLGPVGDALRRGRRSAPIGLAAAWAAESGSEPARAVPPLYRRTADGGRVVLGQIGSIIRFRIIGAQHRDRTGIALAPPHQFAADSPLEGAVTSELVSGTPNSLLAGKIQGISSILASVARI